jgi:hypothetical protein
MMTLSLIDCVILSLAAWRLSYMIVREDGPFRVLLQLRDRTVLGGLLECVFCVSLWAAVGLIMIWFTPLRPLVYILAISGGAVMLAAWTGVEFQR